MAENQIQFKKIRETGEIFSDAFSFLKHEYKTIFLLIRGYVLPFIILNAILQVHVQRNILSKIDIYEAEALMENFGPVYLNFFLATLFSLFVQSLFIGAFYSYLEAYIKKGKSGFSLADITPGLFSNSLLALKANLVLFFMVMAGIILCIVPGIYFANTFSILPFIYLFEKKSFSESFQRSFRLVNVQWWNTFLINITGIAIIYFSGLILSFPSLLGGFESGTVTQEPVAAGYPITYWVWVGIASVITSLLWIIPYTFIALQYFNLNERSNQVFPPSQKF